jgi:hypothetical protein
VIDKLRLFLDIDEETREMGHRLWAVLEPAADRVLDHFYMRVDRAQIQPRISGATLTRLKGKQKDHWASLFLSNFDERFVAGVHRIGIRHRDVGLNVASYVAGYMAIKIDFVNVIVHTDLPTLTKGHLIRALDKYVAFDMALALSSYDAAIID